MIICGILTVLVITYALLALLAFTQAKKIIKKYKNYPHLPIQTLPNSEWSAFIRHDQHKWPETKILIGAIIRFPFKFGLVFFFIFFAFVFMVLTIPLKNPHLTNECLRFYGRHIGWNILRMVYSIDQPQNINKYQIKTPLMISNHVCFFDTIYLLITFFPISFLSKAEVAKIPIAGTVVNTIQSIYIQRASENERNSIKAKITDRVQKFTKSLNDQEGLGEVYPLMIFPQGTTSNGHSLMSFKLGAFNDRAPITIVSLKYEADGFDYGMVELTQGEHMILSCCLKSSIEVKMCEIEAEKDETSDEYCLRAQKMLSEMTGFKVYNCGYRERKEHEKMVNEMMIKEKESMNKEKEEKVIVGRDGKSEKTD